MTFTDDDIDHVIELRGVYDGWSVAVLKNGIRVNRWAGIDGQAIPGYERRWKMTEDYLAGRAIPGQTGDRNPLKTPQSNEKPPQTR